MATLEKIRSKSVFLLVIIAVALLAFILGDALTNGQNLFGNRSTVAQVGDIKIDIQEYQQKREELANRIEEMRKQNPQQVAGFDMQTLPELALNELINEKLIDAAVKKLGIRVSGEQLRFYMMENPINQNLGVLLQQMNQNGISVQTPQQAYDIIFNPKRNGMTEAQVEPYQRLWLSLEEETKQMVKRQMYQQLLVNSVKANELDKQAIYNDYVATTQVEYAFKPFGELDAKKYPVSDAEIKAEYEACKEMFKLDLPTKSVSFIAVDIQPSAADRNAAKKLAAVAITEINKNGQLGKESKREGVSIEHKELRASDIRAGQIKDFLMTAPLDTARLVSENPQGFLAARLLSKSTQSDSIQVTLVQVVGEQLPAKVLARLNESGLSADSVAHAYSPDSIMVQKEQWFPLYTAEGATNVIEKGQLDSLRNAGGKFITLMQTPQGSILAKLDKETAPVEIYSYDEISYRLKPGSKTVNDARSKLEKFLLTNNDATKFAANATKAGYNLQNFDFTQSTPAVPRMAGMNQYYPDSRQVVRWVMIDGKKNEVSHLYESKDAFAPALYVVAIQDEYKNYTPVTNKEVKDYIEARVRAKKAGEAMTKEYSSCKSVDQAAQKMGVTKTNNNEFRFGSNPNLNDNTIVGAISGTKPGNKVSVKAGDNGIAVFRVAGNGKASFPYNAMQAEQQYMQFISPDLTKMLRGDLKFKNNIYKFEAGD
ncbi:MAG: SurA N-terminal domain-containing protein [Prevotella sp.]|nr:SurA N-terminal domain-containing protein [Bacteroides sp.]MCM1367115.1 SurA N-terminal domain-containing protein [Prevotella sp.]MCM1437354.1 SurA N-terminal domain-containing protein [Prevotella sp.]